MNFLFSRRREETGRGSVSQRDCVSVRGRSEVTTNRAGASAPQEGHRHSSLGTPSSAERNHRDLVSRGTHKSKMLSMYFKLIIAFSIYSFTVQCSACLMFSRTGALCNRNVCHGSQHACTNSVVYIRKQVRWSQHALGIQSAL